MSVLALDMAQSESQMCAEFAELLGLPEPVDEAVLHAALSSDSYARSLLASRRTPQMLRMLLMSPPRQVRARAEHSTAELFQRGSRSLVNWAKSGFSTTDPLEREQRSEACRQCPHRQAPGASLLQATRSELGICGLCGCPLSRKVSMLSESCPGEMPDTPGVNRWGQVITVSQPSN
ncbi:DNA replication terminus site-binding protein [Pseudomonas sp. 18.1.10]|uniref:DNA replication terminus site-binding protein n=1 Tax=Pseudomonas sp. 18.1.10 TaxID=2969302 RepID=UPI002150486D|nr:DNA replication terminus site-binding protein [Pseudomonas sp. 18.1.10]MCR4539546.1 DNA replication terminus site-binding protein [Pseudomonas sp. 18.1.10]